MFGPLFVLAMLFFAVFAAGITFLHINFRVDGMSFGKVPPPVLSDGEAHNLALHVRRAETAVKAMAAFNNQRRGLLLQKLAVERSDVNVLTTDESQRIVADIHNRFVQLQPEVSLARAALCTQARELFRFLQDLKGNRCDISRNEAVLEARRLLRAGLKEKKFCDKVQQGLLTLHLEELLMVA